MAQALTIRCPVVAKTARDADVLFGFNDICPWNPSGDALVVLRVPGELDRLPGPGDTAEVCIWRPDGSSLEPIARTGAWNFQQGCRARWLSDDTLLYNFIDDGEERAAVVSVGGTPIRILPKAVYALPARGTQAISPSFGRVHAYCPGYGYPVRAPDLEADAPHADGVWSVDIETGATRLLRSFADLAEASPLPRHGPQFVSHMWYNRSGREFLFVHSVFAADGGAYANLLVMDRDGANLRRAGTERITHPCWLNETRIAAWARNSAPLGRLRRQPLLQNALARRLVRLVRHWQGPMRNRLLNEGLIAFDADGRGQPRILGSDLITENGHFSQHPAADILVGDTYPDRHGQLHLYLYDFERNIRIDVASFDHGVRWPNGHLRSDLHPRWDRSGRQVAVDISEDGARRVAIVDVTPALAALGIG